MSRTITTEKTVFLFDELSDSAKDKAVQAWCETSSELWDGDHVLEDAKEIGKLLGIWVDNIYYSGFYSQGDGASWTGSYSYARGAVKAVKEYCNDPEIIRIAEELQKLQKSYFYGLYANVTVSGYYSHSKTMQVSVGHRQENDSWSSFYTRELPDEDIKEVLRDFADWVYRRLRDDYEYSCSEENALEYFRDFEVEFDEYGNAHF